MAGWEDLAQKLLEGTGFGRTPGDFAQQDAQTQALQQQNQIGALQLSGLARQQQQAEQYQQDTSAYLADPQPKRLAQLIVKYPDQAKQIKDAFDVLNEPARTSRKLIYSQIYNAALNGQPDLVADQINNVVRAEKGAGIDTSAGEKLKEMLANKDPRATKMALGFAQAHLGIIDPAFAKSIGVGEDQDQFASTGDNAIYSKRTGEVVRQGVSSKKVTQVPIYNEEGKRVGTQLVDETGNVVEGGSQNSSGTAAPPPGAARYTGGWTPRARNGGDNPDNVVDNKIAGMSQHLGIDSTAPFPPGMSNMQIAQALALSEGGTGSLADRNNNPTNLTDGKGGYRKFATKEQALTAAAVQVARNRARGQNTIQSMVEGLPAKGGPQTAAQRSGYFGPVEAASGDDTSGGLTPEALNFAADSAIAHGGKVPPGFARNKAAQVAIQNAIAQRAGAKGLTVDEVIAAGQDTDTASKSLVKFATGKQGDTVRSLNVAIDHLAILHDAARALDSGDVPTFNRLSQWWQRQTGGALPGNASAIRGIVSDEVNKAVLGGAGALADRKDLKDNLDTAGSPAQIAGLIRTYVGLMAGQANGLKRQYEQSTGRHDFERFLEPNTKKALGLSGATSRASAAVRVTSRAQAMALKPGTVFITPDGRRLVR